MRLLDTKDISQILISDEYEREQKIHDLIKDRRSLNINIELSKRLTTGQKAADKMAVFTGSWKFIIIFSAIVLAWGIANTRLILADPFDPYPYVFLNLILACISSIQAPVIMMSQNREAQKDRLRAENEYLINTKSEIILEDLHLKIDNIINRQHLLEDEMENLMGLIEDLRKEIVLGRELNGEKTNRREESDLYN
ncbi:DUF1003 domain-containing protein [Lutispora thermophila]|uniref:DUF1003 domain-containing protein n=1 Tax=Lutispora saccharofermentans TaxID=3024236 RepID=A0ABT1NJY9_9FIRM|nr:DUF1003 domain-containing protein [Lutispora saccharofermentans]